MKLTTFTLSICLYLASTVGNLVQAVPTTQENTEAAASLQMAKWQKQYNRYIEETIATRTSGCTRRNILYRQEWGSLSRKSRMDYIKAVQCLQKKPPISPASDVPGARSHFDDFFATHITQAPYVHFSGLFFHFHRYFLWLYETALRQECGYKGAQPYWDWTRSWQDPRKSTVFDGSPTSLGGNGKPIPHGPTTITAFGVTLDIAPATGGGCIYSGPFVNYTVNLGPVAFAPVGPDHGLGYNPRCLTRDISLVFGNRTKPTDVTGLIESCTDLGCFDANTEALDGVHAAGHFTMGGLGMDAYASPGDPAFWLHHAQVDRVWTIWQNLNAQNRTNQVYGTSTAFNVPPSANVTLKTEIDFGVLAPKQTVGSLVSSIDGPFCYVYI